MPETVKTETVKGYSQAGKKIGRPPGPKKERDPSKKYTTRGTILTNPETISKKTSFDKIIKQRSKNPLMSITDQAKLNGVTKQALSSMLKRHGVESKHVEDYKEHRADIFAGKQEIVLRHFDASALKRMVEKAPMAAVSLFGVLYDKERLERGQSTSNVATILATAVIEAGKQWVKPQPALDPITVDPAPCIDGEIISG